jgi:hypothetical protein
MFVLKSQPDPVEIPQALNHYVEHMDNFIQNKFQGQVTVEETIFDNAINEGDSEYFAKLPIHTQTALDMLYTHSERLIFCMTRYTN